MKNKTTLILKTNHNNTIDECRITEHGRDFVLSEMIEMFQRLLLGAGHTPDTVDKIDIKD